MDAPELADKRRAHVATRNLTGIAVVLACSYNQLKHERIGDGTDLCRRPRSPWTILVMPDCTGVEQRTVGCRVVRVCDVNSNLDNLIELERCHRGLSRRMFYNLYRVIMRFRSTTGDSRAEGMMDTARRRRSTPKAELVKTLRFMHIDNGWWQTHHILPTKHDTIQDPSSPCLLAPRFCIEWMQTFSPKLMITVPGHVEEPLLSGVAMESHRSRLPRVQRLLDTGHSVAW